MKKAVFSGVAGVVVGLSVAACTTMDDGAEAGTSSLLPASAALCQPGEQALFQCQAGSRTIALCAGGAGGERYVQYRYGSPGAVELAYPTRGLAGLSRANIPFSGGGETQVNFSNGGASYSVYSRTVRTGFDERGNNPEFSAGVTVQQNGRPAVEIGCTAPADASFEAATYELLPEGAPATDD